jgi:tRNA(fMet)-specific endonuclease VapC
MSPGALLLLDTSVVLHLARGRATGDALDKQFGLRQRPDRPLISIITVGELFAFARRRSWGGAKQDQLRRIVEQLVVVDVRNTAVLEKYSDSGFALSGGLSRRAVAALLELLAAATGARLVAADLGGGQRGLGRVQRPLDVGDVLWRLRLDADDAVDARVLAELGQCLSALGGLDASDGGMVAGSDSCHGRAPRSKGGSDLRRVAHAARLD